METSQMYDVLDLTLKTLYEHLNNDGLHFENDILRPNKIKLSAEEAGRVWDVLMATGLADGIIGFGNGGKLEITPAGIQMMTRYGSYKNFLATQQSATSQPSQLTIQLASGENGKAEAEDDAADAEVKPAKSKGKPAKKAARPSKK